MRYLTEVTFDIWSVLLIFGLLQGLFLSAVLIAGNTRKKSKYYLSILVMVISLNLLNYIVLNSQLYTKIPHFAHLSLPALFLIGPLFFFYVRSVLHARLTLKLTDILHGLPFLLSIIYLLPFFVLPGTEKLQLLHSQWQLEHQTFDVGTQVFTVAQIVQSFIYVMASLRVISKKSQEQTIRQNEFRMDWLQKFAFGFLVFWLVDFLAVLWFFHQGHIDVRAYYLSMLCCALAINLLVFLAIQSHRTYVEVFLDNPRVKYKSSRLLDSDIKEHLSQITAYMENERPYLHHDLSLSQLSEDLNKPKHLISQVLNMELGKSFYEFLNEYRYREARSRLIDPQYSHLTILAIAYDAGFSNKNTFNKVFKKFSGITPSEFLKSIPKADI